MQIDYSKYPANWKTDNRPENLAALCQRCHLLHDREQHRETRRRNRVQKSSETRE